MARKHVDGSSEPDYRSVQLRRVWEKVCKPMGYPDPRKEPRMYASTTVKLIETKRSKVDLQDSARNLGLGRVTIRTKKALARKVSIIPYMKVLFTDLTSPDNPEEHIQLQYGARKVDEGDISHQGFGDTVRLFSSGDHIHNVTDPNLAMFMDLCGQCVDSPVYLDEKQQAALGFRIEILKPIQQAARLFKTYGFEKTINAPAKIKSDNTKLIEAQITMGSYTKTMQLCQGFGIDPKNMREQDMKAALYAKCADPSTHSKFMELLSATRTEISNDVYAAYKGGLLEFGKDSQWYIKAHPNQVEKGLLLRGTMMADCVTDDGGIALDTAISRLVDIMAGNQTQAPRTDITREIRNALNKEYFRTEVTDKVMRATGDENHVQVLEAISDYLNEGVFYYDKKAGSYKWRDNGKMIVSVNPELGRPLDQFRNYVEGKGLQWLHKNCAAHALDKETV